LPIWKAGVCDDNTQKLRYEIDPGCIATARTYFYSSSHQREGISGALKTEDYNNRLNKLGL